MENSVLQNLKFRRQYIITPHKIECPFNSNLVKISNNYTLYTHIDLKTTEYSDNGIRIILLGDMFDYENPEKNNIDILIDLIDLDYLRFLEKTFKYSGRFIIIYIKENSINIAHDATAARKVYYCKMNNFFWLASQPYLLATVLNLKETVNPSKIAFYNSTDFQRLHNSNLGDTTRFDEIHQLLPNHYYDFALQSPVRYWPNKKLENLPVLVAAEKCSQMIKGFLESIGKRYNIMLPVTAGKDSRVLLAATRSFKDKVFYYINKNKTLNDKSNDISIPKTLFSKLNIDFHVINPYIPIDEAFEKIYFENNKYASSYFLPHIYNYFKNYSDKVNVPGMNASSAHGIWTLKDIKPTAINLAKLNTVASYEYAIQYYEKWLSGCLELCILNNLSFINLFYWEERLGNWGTQIQLEKDIAQEEFNPFNSRQLIELILSVEPKYLEIPNFILFRKIIRILWPELLKVSFNPGFEAKIRKILIFVRLHGIFVKYKQKITNFLTGL